MIQKTITIENDQDNKITEISTTTYDSYSSVLRKIIDNGFNNNIDKWLSPYCGHVLNLIDKKGFFELSKLHDSAYLVNYVSIIEKLKRHGLIIMGSDDKGNSYVTTNRNLDLGIDDTTITWNISFHS